MMAKFMPNTSLTLQHRSIILILAILMQSTFASEYRTSLRLIKAATESIQKCDSLVLVSVDKKELNHGIGHKPKDGSIIKKVEPKPVYHDVPVLEIATVKDRQNIREIGSKVLIGLDKKPIAIAACLSWVGSLFIYTKGHEVKIDFDDLNGYIWLEKRGHLYQIYGSPSIWNEIMTKALGQPSIAEGPCHDAAKLSWNSNP